MFTWVDDDFRFNTKIATHSRVNSSYRGSILISSNYTALAMVTLNTPHQVARSDATQDIDYGSLIITNDYVPV
ncbi:unnamed protein product [Tilletia controversa]|uniref:Uncharacterized protein n=1 Tax=Tilletia controversa TaxID=13291 RepID=A0A8X7MPY6_9BASI|nr:hypothetical protein A4X06_0g6259 [Tilletia controversa]CAD6951606.1 unnamed protein product [Tilletia controversa]